LLIILRWKLYYKILRVGKTSKFNIRGRFADANGGFRVFSTQDNQKSILIQFPAQDNQQMNGYYMKTISALYEDDYARFAYSDVEFSFYAKPDDTDNKYPLGFSDANTAIDRVDNNTKFCFQKVPEIAVMCMFHPCVKGYKDMNALCADNLGSNPPGTCTDEFCCSSRSSFAQFGAFAAAICLLVLSY
jgi:hypothetical protein